MKPQDDWPSRLTRSIAAQVQRHRKQREWSAQRLADECGKLGLEITRSTLADLENGRRVTLSVAELLVIARALDVPPLLLVFPAGSEETVEALPGTARPAWRAAQWITGEGPFPAPGDNQAPGPGWVCPPLTMYRDYDRRTGEEAAALVMAGEVAGAAESAADEVSRRALLTAADAERQLARQHRDARRVLREQLTRGGWLPPEPR
jgi:transcriptional regulator with XRE-family HTH domain